jgi:hypothetical protein
MSSMHQPVHRETRDKTASVPVPVAEDAMGVDDGALLLLGEGAALEVRPEVVDPPEPAALAAPLQPWSTRQEHDAHQDSGGHEQIQFLPWISKTDRTGVLGDGAPAAVAVGGDVLDQLLVLLRRPQPALHLLLAAAVVPHGRPTAPLPSLLSP